MKIETRIKDIVTYTIDDFYNSLRYTDKSTETLIKWLTNDLLQLKDIEEYPTIEVSLLALEKLNSLDIVNLEFIIETISRSLSNSENEIIHISMPKIL